MKVDSQPSNSVGEDFIVFALGCFWGAERIFWQLPGVVSTEVGYIAGQSTSPTYQEVCSGTTGHTEAVRVVYLNKEISLGQLLQVFWESHDPTQGNRQGNDRGTQYRSGIYTSNKDALQEALSSMSLYGAALQNHGYPPITTEIHLAEEFWSGEEYHQKYLQKNPQGYCGLGGTGVKFPL